jgi:hypothetical protein
MCDVVVWRDAMRTTGEERVRQMRGAARLSLARPPCARRSAALGIAPVVVRAAARAAPREPRPLPRPYLAAPARSLLSCLAPEL